MYKSLLHTLLGTILGGSLLGSAAAAPVVIQVDPQQKCGAVNPLVFGHNIEAANAKGLFGTKDTAHPLTGDGVWNPKQNQPVPEIVAMAKNIKMGMLRYPGGCLTHNFDWHQAVGAKKDRTYYRFGIDEYVELCRAIGAEPLMNVSELCTPKDAADLVEYLNLPATPEHPWAMKRAEWGHKEPFHVKYFEMANESDHGNHNVKPALKRSADEYAQWYLDCAAAMRAKDKNILVGGHGGTGTPVSDPWNATVLKLAGNKMDFFAVHTYVVGGRSETTDLPMRGCMASTEQITAKLAEYRAMIKKETGKDIPLAITEFNAGFTQDKPVPLRFTFGAALFSADYVREMMKPENNVMFANYWQLINGFWGGIRTKTVNDKTAIETRAAYPVFKLLAQHTGTELIGCTVANEPKLEYEGCNAAMAAKKEFLSERRFLNAIPLKLNEVKNKTAQAVVTGPDSLEVNCAGTDGESYLNMNAFPIKPGNSFILTFDARVTPVKGQIAPGLGMVDARGWDATLSGCGIQGTSTAKDWVSMETGMVPRKDATGLHLVVRLINAENFTGKIEFRNIKLAEYEPRSFPPYSAVTAFATGTADPKVINVIVFNKHTVADQPAEIKLANVASAKLWSVSAPDLAAIKHAPDAVWERVSGQPVGRIAADGLSLTLPARSINALEIRLK